MTLDDVRHLDDTLQTRGEALSANKIVEHLGGSKRDALRLLRELRAEAQPLTPVPATATATLPAPAPAAVATPAPPPEETPPPAAELLQQAQEQLRLATVAAHAAKRAYDFAPQQDRERLQQAMARCAQARDQAQDLVEKRLRSRDVLIATIPSLRIAARRAAGTLAATREEVRRRLLREGREAELAQGELDQAIHDLTTIAGREAVPVETLP